MKEQLHIMFRKVEGDRIFINGEIYETEFS